jgi:polyphosphate glucokinase
MSSQPATPARRSSSRRATRVAAPAEQDAPAQPPPVTRAARPARARSAASTAEPAGVPAGTRRASRGAGAVAVADLPAVQTLAIDIGGTGLKATVLDAAGAELVPRLRMDTTYPCPPEEMVSRLVTLVAPLPRFDRASVGFPGVVRKGVVLSAPHFVTAKGPGSKVVASLSTAWDHFPLAERLAAALTVPVRLANDADLQGSAVVDRTGLEVVLTLGTGVGSAVFNDGALTCHLELAHHPLDDGRTYNDMLGEAARRKIGNKRWNRRVVRAVATVDALLVPDRIFVGGGNSAHVKADLGPKVKLISNEAGLLGGITLWQTPTP